jgi:hypothetical protein
MGRRVPASLRGHHESSASSIYVAGSRRGRFPGSFAGCMGGNTTITWQQRYLAVDLLLVISESSLGHFRAAVRS